MPGRIRGASSRSARLGFGAEFTAELDAGTSRATAPASGEPFVEVRDAEAAQESRGNATHGQCRWRWMPARASLGTP